MILILAKEYGQSPQAVEEWDEYWFNRAVVDLQGRAQDDARRAKEARKRK
jgi:hypothetical protein